MAVDNTTGEVPGAARERAPGSIAAIRAANVRGNWVFDPERGRYLNTVTGEYADEPQTDVPDVANLDDALEWEEDGFTLTETQFRQGMRLAVSERSGLVRRCPECGKRRLLLLPKDGKLFLVCGDALNDEPACDFHRAVTDR
jgi:hypothetical protein